MSHEFNPTHRYRGTAGDPSILAELVGPGLHEGEARVRFEGNDGASRVASSSLIALDSCSCEWEDDGDGESGPHLVQHIDSNCPVHGDASPDRDRIDSALAALGAQVGLDETYPEGDAALAALWTVALVGADAQTDPGEKGSWRAEYREAAVRDRASLHVAAAIMVLNFGPECLGRAA